jgi:LysR family transcriptional regulator, regulator for genes of the gallate degradation pathway
MEGQFLPSLRQLRTFAAVARFEGISRAAARLHRSQSAVTQAIASLEAKLEVPLFVRRSKGSYLTDYGKILEKHATRFFETIEDAIRELADEIDPVRRVASAAASDRITNSQVQALIAIYERGSLTQAARQLGVSQTSVHRSARSLEAQLQRELFQNTALGVTTNARGGKFAERVLQATRGLEAALEEVDAKRGVVRGRILIGALALAGTYFLASKLSQFVSAYQFANVTVINGPYDALLPKLRAGSVDFLVGLLKNPAPADDVVEEELLPDPYVIAVRQDHPLAGKKRVRRTDLVGFDWILAPSGAWRRIVFENTFPGLTGPHSNIETHSLPTIASMLATTDRMTILTQSELHVAHQQGQRLEALNFGPIEPSTAIGVTIRRDCIRPRCSGYFSNFCAGERCDGRLHDVNFRRQGFMSTGCKAVNIPNPSFSDQLVGCVSIYKNSEYRS